MVIPDTRALRPQLMVLGTLAVVYAALAAFWVPPHNRLLLPLGLVAMLAAGELGRRQGPGRPWLPEPAFVWLALVMLIVIPGVANPPAPRGRGFVAGFLGVFCALGAWAVFRYPAPRPAWRRPLGQDLAQGLMGGAGMAALLSLVALCIGGAAALGGGERMPLGWIIAAYWAGGLAAGAVVGLTRRLARWPLASMLIGVPVAMAVYGAAAVSMMMAGEAPGQEQTPESIHSLVIGIGLAAGPMMGLMLRNEASG